MRCWRRAWLVWVLELIVVCGLFSCAVGRNPGNLSPAFNVEQINGDEAVMGALLWGKFEVYDVDHSISDPNAEFVDINSANQALLVWTLRADQEIGSCAADPAQCQYGIHARVGVIHTPGEHMKRMIYHPSDSVQQTEPFAMNDAANVVGAFPRDPARSVDSSSSVGGFLYTYATDTFTDLDPTGIYYQVWPWEINNSGVIVGWFTRNSSDTSHAFATQAGVVTELALPAEASTMYTSAEAINDNGTILVKASNGTALFYYLYDLSSGLTRSLAQFDSTNPADFFSRTTALTNTGVVVVNIPADYAADQLPTIFQPDGTQMTFPTSNLSVPAGPVFRRPSSTGALAGYFYDSGNGRYQATAMIPNIVSPTVNLSNIHALFDADRSGEWPSALNGSTLTPDNDTAFLSAAVSVNRQRDVLGLLLDFNGTCRNIVPPAITSGRQTVLGPGTAARTKVSNTLYIPRADTAPASWRHRPIAEQHHSPKGVGVAGRNRKQSDRKDWRARARLRRHRAVQPASEEASAPKSKHVESDGSRPQAAAGNVFAQWRRFKVPKHSLTRQPYRRVDRRKLQQINSSPVLLITNVLIPFLVRDGELYNLALRLDTSVDSVQYVTDSQVVVVQHTNPSYGSSFDSSKPLFFTLTEITPTPSPTPTVSLSPSESPTASPSVSVSPTASPSPSESPTVSPSPTETPTVSPSPSESPTESLIVSPSATESPTASPSPTELPTTSASPTELPTASPSPSVSPSSTKSPTVSPSPMATPTVSPLRTQFPTVSPSPTDLPSVSPSRTESPTNTGAPSASRTVTSTPLASPTAMTSPTQLPTSSGIPSVTRAPTATVSSTERQTATPSLTGTRNVTPSGTQSRTVTAEPTKTRTFTPSETWTPTVTASSTGTLTVSPSATGTRTVTQSLARTPSSTRSPTASSTSSQTVTRTVSRSPTCTRTSSPLTFATRTASRLPTSTHTPSPSPSQTVTPTASPSPTVTPTASPSPTVTPTASHSPTVTWTASRSPTVTSTPSQSPTTTRTPSYLPTATRSFIATLTPTNTQTRKPTVTRTISPTRSASHVPTPTPSSLCLYWSENTEPVRMSCPPNLVFYSITDALFGGSVGVCPNAPTPKPVAKPGACNKTLDVRSRVGQRCLGRTVCYVGGAALIDDFGDPCPGVRKPFRVAARCQYAPPIGPVNVNGSVCVTGDEYDNPSGVSITCSNPRQKITEVSIALYGRPQGSCSTGWTAGPCEAGRVDRLVRTKCVGRSVCAIGSGGFNNEFGGDPCKGKRKTFVAVYKCG